MPAGPTQKIFDIAARHPELVSGSVVGIVAGPHDGDVSPGDDEQEPAVGLAAAGVRRRDGGRITRFIALDSAGGGAPCSLDGQLSQ